LPQAVVEDLRGIMGMDWSPGTSVGDILKKDIDQNYNFSFLTKNGIPKLQTRSSERDISRPTFGCFGKLCLRDLEIKNSRN